jgi:zinc protease
VLPNGLAVVVQEDRRLPTVTAMLAYRVGSVNEPEGLTGVSHFFEHMVFKGTGKYKRGEIDLVTYRCGGQNNAFTTHDMTGYWFHVGSRHLDAVLDILSDTMGNCTLDPKEFDLERNTVLQEMNIWLDGPWGELEREMARTVYREGGYRHPVLGWREDVEKLTRDQMMAYYREHYTPANASLVLVGDIDREEAFRRASKFFGGIPRGKESSRARPAEPPQQEERSVSLATSKAADRVLLAFRAEPAGTETDIVLDLIAAILSEGRNSRLSRRLVEKEDLAGEGNVSAFNESRRHEGLFSVGVEVAIDASADRVREVVIEELEALRTGAVTDRELRRAKNILRAKFAFEAESQFELTSKIGYFEALGLPDYVRDYMERVERVTADAVAACARRIFVPANRTVGVGKAKAKRRPEGAGRPGRRRPLDAPGCPPRRRAAAVQEAPSFGAVHETRLPNGLTILVKPRRDVPVLALQAFVDAGILTEPEEKAGVAMLTGDLLDDGVEDDAGRILVSEGVVSPIEFAGGEYETAASGAAVKVLSEHAAVAFDFLRDTLRWPSFPEERVKDAVEDMLVRIESMEDDPAEVARRLFYEQAFRGHRYHRPAIGYAETVRKLGRDDVVAHHRRHYRPENTILAVAGDIDPARAVEEARARFGSWRGEGGWKAPVPAAASRQREARRLFSTYRSSQVRFHLGHVGIERADPDYFTLRVAETILCDSPGFTNRLARVVRDEEGLAYDIAGSITAGAGHVAGPFQVVLGVDAKDKDKALGLVTDQIRKFVEEGPTEEEVRDARNYLMGSFVGAWETTEDLAAYLVEVRRYGLGADYPARFFRGVSAVTRESVRRAARKHLDLANLTVVAVGPVDKEGNLLKEGDK